MRMSLLRDLRAACQRRAEMSATWVLEDTDCYRLFHGVAEGRPGLSIDRYGPLLVAQCRSTQPLDDQERSATLEFLEGQEQPFILACRDGASLVCDGESTSGLWNSTFWCRELGLEFAINLSRAHRDPQLFLDFRSSKRALLRALAGLGPEPSALNLFAFTCSVSAHLLKAGAGPVWSVDFSSGNLNWGMKNFRRNRLDVSAPRARFLPEDCVGLLWALTGKRKLRKGLKSPVAPRTFSVVVVDPPVWSKGRFAAVDMVRDPETVLAPAWEVVSAGGLMLASNNSAQVSREQFRSRLERLLEKRGGCASLEWILPDADFPSFDGEPPLKVALCRKL
jgi:23S rRNA (cytosine1962-C5)-methyltransferase